MFVLFVVVVVIVIVVMGVMIASMVVVVMVVDDLLGVHPGLLLASSAQLAPSTDVSSNDVR
jgi:hypothetical protein